MFIFFNDIVLFVTTTLQKLFEKSPIGSVVVANACALNPGYIFEHGSDALQAQMKRLLTHFVEIEDLFCKLVIWLHINTVK